MAEAPFSPDYPASVVGGELRLPKPPGVIRQFWARHPRFTDALIAGLYFVPTFISFVVLALGPDGPLLWIAFAQSSAIVATGTALLLYRRRHPWVLMGVAWAVCLLVYPFGMTDVLPILFALYALGVYRSTRSAWVGFAGSVAVGTASSYVAASLDASGLVTPFGAGAAASASQFAITMLIATLIGVTVGNRRRYLSALIDRAHDLARERDQQAQFATAIERSRIAREMHDIVSHSLTVMVTLADGSAATVDSTPDRAAEAMRRVAETGRAALGDMRRMLGVLSEPATAPPDLAPQPGSAAISELVERFRATGLPLRLTTEGPPVPDPNLQLTIYRIVQEGLTNVLRHAATASNVDVTIHHRNSHVRVTVTDDAAATPRSSDADGGHGLVGMRERVALYGGTLEAGPRPGLGWRVIALLHADYSPLDPGERHE